MAAENDHLFALKTKEEIDAALKEKVMATFFTPVPEDKPDNTTYWYVHHVRFYIRDRIVFTFDVDPRKFKIVRTYTFSVPQENDIRGWLYQHGFDYFNITNTWSDRSTSIAYSSFKDSDYEQWASRKEQQAKAEAA